MSRLTVFSMDEMERILQLDKSSPAWVLRKALAAVKICGGLRYCEARNLTIRDVVTDDKGVWIQYCPEKQTRAETEKSNDEFMVPFNREKPHLCYASCLINYMDEARITNIQTKNHYTYKQ